MSQAPTMTGDPDQLAAEFALGVLDGEDFSSARARVAADTEFRALVARWTGRLAPLLDEIEPREPPEELWSAIEQRLGSVRPAGADIIDINRRLNRWRGFAAGATALAASLALILVTRPAQPPVVETPPAVDAPAPDPLVAMLGDEQAPVKLVATWDPGDRQLVLAAAGELAADAGRAHELWVIPAGGEPRSLGTIPSTPRMHIQLDEGVSAQLRRGATLAVTVEPAGGSPTGLPTGPIIASGPLESA